MNFCKRGVQILATRRNALKNGFGRGMRAYNLTHLELPTTLKSYELEESFCRSGRVLIEDMRGEYRRSRGIVVVRAEKDSGKSTTES